jgi:hypothetical protein
VTDERPTGCALVDAFFAPWEKIVEDFDEINETISTLFQRLIRDEGRLFAWRGVVNASWPLHSSLYRRILWTHPAEGTPLEPAVAELEVAVLKSVHRWGLHNGERGRLSVLAQLATLQHFGAPTRLIDVTMNAYIGLWFAVQREYRDGIPVDDADEVDGRVFAIDITNRLINEINPPDADDEGNVPWTAHRGWEDETLRPWKEDPEEWSAHTWAWQPPHFEARIASQNGAFLFGGIPRSQRGLRWPMGRGAHSRSWHLDEVRRCTSLPLRMHVAEPGGGGAQQPAYTFRIKADAKPEIRERLRALFGFQHSTIYPDFPGFSSFADPALRSSPPRG